jgi:biopolymer transport protein ExbB
VIETLDETVTEHILRGGPVVWPILGLAAAALMAAIGKWISLSHVPSPSRKRIDPLLQCVEEGRLDAAKEAAAGIRGPTGEMLAAGVALIGKPVELLEEVMYERVLVTRLKVQRLLPFIAISAAAAPLLGLLGTVTGIISTFKLITVFGTGDVKTLSGGISEALITTELGLIAAIPALLLHAYLSRKAKGITDRMEQSALSLVNGVAIGQPDARDAGSDQAGSDASPGGGNDASAAESARDALVELLGPLLEERRGSGDSRPKSDPA